MGEWRCSRRIVRCVSLGLCVHGYFSDCPFHLLAAFVWLIHHPGESVPSAQKNKHSLDPRREAGDGEEESVCVEVLKHALDGLAVDPERDAGSPQVQTAAHHIL